MSGQRWATGSNDPGYLPDSPEDICVHATLDEAKQALIDALYAEAEALVDMLADEIRAWPEGEGGHVLLDGTAYWVQPTEPLS